jgi:hypothetical protein
MTYIATVLDTTGIQPYIFGSNRLRENIGASYLVSQATDAWVKWALTQLGENAYIPNQNIEEGGTVAEIIYTGGGNARLLFSDLDCAKKFTKTLSRKILQDAPGLKIVVTHSQPFAWGNQLSSTFNELMQDLDRKKCEYTPSAPLLGLGVTASCNSTGLVAVNTSDRFSVPDSYLVSREIVEKLRVVDPKYDQLANKHLIETVFKGIREVESEEYTIPYDVDDLGRIEGKSSYMAIVHTDGNSMGDRFKSCGKGKPDREYINDIQQLSDSVKQAGIEALQRVAKQLVEAVKKEQGGFPITIRNRKKFLPFRPLVYGGDDVTFVCDGRLGLSLATCYLQSFETRPVPEGQEPFTACAGIAIVKTHYPFSRAYQLSEALCGSAKKFVRDEKKRLKLPEESSFSALDWHIAATGLLGSINEIRQREYQVAQGSLTLRPVYLQSDEEWRSWMNVELTIQAFKYGEGWQERRNKVTALREVLREGADATKHFLHLYSSDNSYLPSLSNLDSKDFRQRGWTDDPRTNQEVCGYFDAIEAMDFYINLEDKQ